MNAPVPYDSPDLSISIECEGIKISTTKRNSRKRTKSLRIGAKVGGKCGNAEGGRPHFIFAASNPFPKSNSVATVLFNSP